MSHLYGFHPIKEISSVIKGRSDNKINTKVKSTEVIGVSFMMVPRLSLARVIFFFEEHFRDDGSCKFSLARLILATFLW